VLNNESQPQQGHSELSAESPEKLAQIPSGALVAATLSPLLGFLTLMLSHHISRLSNSLDQAVLSFGRWLPGAVGAGADGSTGSYAGKEILAFMVWISSWAIFHFLWRDKEFSIRDWIPWFLGGLLFAMLGFFHPFIDPIILFIAESLSLI
jgi:hypothetical protein